MTSCFYDLILQKFKRKFGNLRTFELCIIEDGYIFL